VNNRRKLPALHLKASLTLGMDHCGRAFKARSGVISLDSHNISSVWQAIAVRLILLLRVVELSTADKRPGFEDSVTGQALEASGELAATHHSGRDSGNCAMAYIGFLLMDVRRS